MREATTFSRILEIKVRFKIWRKLLRSSVDRYAFLRRGWTRACLNDDGKIPSERERLTRFVMTGPIKFIEAEFQKECWGVIKGTLFAFRSWNEFVNFSKSGWNKIDQLWKRGRWTKKQIRGMRWNKFGADSINFIFEKVKECVGKGGWIWGLWKWVWRISMKKCSGAPDQLVSYNCQLTMCSVATKLRRLAFCAFTKY